MNEDRMDTKQPQIIEIEANTVNEAIKKAINILHVSRNEVDIKVLKEEKKGLFGLKSRHQAKIRVQVKQND